METLIVIVHNLFSSASPLDSVATAVWEAVFGAVTQAITAAITAIAPQVLAAIGQRLAEANQTGL